MNMLKISAIVLGATAAMIASTGSAFAFSFSIGGTNAGTEGYKSSQVGAKTIDFDNGVAPTSGFVTYSGVKNNIVQGSVGGQYATPAGDTSKFMTISNVSSKAVGNTGSVTLNFAKAIDYFGLYWGSVDKYNFVDFFSGGKKITTFGGGDISSTATGSWTGASDNLYVNFFSGPGQTFDQIVLRSDNPAFESDNHAYREASAAVPEPFTMGGVALAGMGLSYVRRRQAKQAV